MTIVGSYQQLTGLQKKDLVIKILETLLDESHLESLKPLISSMIDQFVLVNKDGKVSFNTGGFKSIFKKFSCC